MRAHKVVRLLEVADDPRSLNSRGPRAHGRKGQRRLAKDPVAAPVVNERVGSIVCIIVRSQNVGAGDALEKGVRRARRAVESGPGDAVIKEAMHGGVGVRVIPTMLVPEMPVGNVPIGSSPEAPASG